MLKKIYIDGFRHFKNFTLEPHFPQTLLCGVNGTGKTTVIEILSCLQAFLINSKSIEDVCSGDNIPRWEEKDFGSFTSTLSFSIEIASVPYEYELVVKYNFKESVCRVEKEILRVHSQLVFSSEIGEATLIADDEKVFTYPVDWNLTGLQLSSRKSSKVRTFLAYIEKHIFTLSINPTADFSEHTGIKDFLELECENFSTWYDKISSENIADVANSFQYIKPFIQGFKQFKYKLYGSKKELFVDIHKKNIKPYELHFNELSHGQKILCILYLVFSTCPENAVIMIDECENFLSPIELQPLYGLIQDVFEEKNVQTILVSHHEKTLNWFQKSAFIFTFSEDKTFIRLKDFSEEENISIEDYLFEHQED